MEKKLEYIIDSAHKSIIINDYTIPEIPYRTVFKFHRVYHLNLQIDSKKMTSIKIDFDTTYRKKEDSTKRFEKEYTKRITSKYPELTVNRYYCQTERREVTELIVPRHKYVRIFN